MNSIVAYRGGVPIGQTVYSYLYYITFPHFRYRFGSDHHAHKFPLQAASGWLHIVPWGIRKLARYVNDNYSNPPVIITENGQNFTSEAKRSLSTDDII